MEGDTMAWIIYLAGVSGNIATLLSMISILILIAVPFVAVIACCEHFDDGRRRAWWKKSCLKAVYAAVAMLFVAALTPSPTAILMMVGAQIVDGQISNPDNREVADKLRQVILQKLDESLEVDQ